MKKMENIRWLIVFAVAWLYHGCATSSIQMKETLPPPVSHWGDRYQYKYDPPGSKAPASIAATVIVVNPSYKEEESTLGQQVYSKVGKGFSASMGVDMDKVIIAKGMTVKGPYAYLDEITYSDKKGADLTLAPKVFVITQTNYVKHNPDAQEWEAGGKKYTRSSTGQSNRPPREPLSGEKMWLKKLELDEIEVKGIESYKAIPQYEEYILSGYAVGELVYDGKVDAVADALKEMYPTIMEKFWTYIDAEEILALKEKTKEIRALKRY